jgi:hypothetical protein
MPQHVVEAAVLEHHDDDVVEAGRRPLRQRVELRRVRGRRGRDGRTGGPADRDPRGADSGASQKVAPGCVAWRVVRGFRFVHTSLLNKILVSLSRGIATLIGRPLMSNS